MIVNDEQAAFDVGSGRYASWECDYGVELVVPDDRFENGVGSVQHAEGRVHDARPVGARCASAI